MTEQLLGDYVEAIAKATKLDKLAKIYEQISKRKCNCKRRKRLLNNFHRRIKGD